MKARYRSVDGTAEWRRHEFVVHVGADGRLDQEDYGTGKYTPEGYAEIAGWVLVGLEDE